MLYNDALVMRRVLKQLVSVLWVIRKILSTMATICNDNPDSGNQQVDLVHALQKARRIVVKLGTQVVVDPNDPIEMALALAENARMQSLVADCAALVQAGKEVIIVSSGAVGLGKQKLGLSQTLTLTEKQACAAIGQNLLMDAYQTLFNRHQLITGQVLLTALDLADRRHYLNLRRTLETLMSFKVIPILNENDPVSTMELQEEGYTKAFGDNDRLSAIVAGKLDADLLVILTNVDGIYTENPSVNPEAKRIPIIESLEELHKIETLGKSTMGRGGMASKLEAAKIAAINGVHTLVVSGLVDRPLAPLFSDANKEPIQGPVHGTLILPKASSISGKKHWIAMASGYHGVVVVNDGAAKALMEKQASLLPIGITEVQGDFEAEQVVSIQDERGLEIGRGLTYFSSKDIDRIKGLHSDKIGNILDSKYANIAYKAVVHRHNLVIFQEYGL